MASEATLVTCAKFPAFLQKNGNTATHTCKKFAGIRPAVNYEQ